MDIFYKPPTERPDECEALELNYMNCLLQKALKDKVAENLCRIEHILWFHLECPSYVGKFDNDQMLKQKFKHFYEDILIDYSLKNRKVRPVQEAKERYGHIKYPEDILDTKGL